MPKIDQIKKTQDQLEARYLKDKALHEYSAEEKKQ